MQKILAKLIIFPWIRVHNSCSKMGCQTISNVNHYSFEQLLEYISKTSSLPKRKLGITRIIFQINDTPYHGLQNATEIVLGKCSVKMARSKTKSR